MKIGLANGCFDLLHEGHLYFLEQCSEHCDYLIVAINSDRSVRRLKGPERPIETLAQRIYNLQARASAWVDAVIPFEGREDCLAMELRPDVIFKGYDHHDPALPETLCMRVPRWRTPVRHGEPDGRSWDTIPIIGIDKLEGHSTSLQLQGLKDKTGAR
jgi:rfaE bifunctional protein nucleotidyltransferase chain/domain